MGYLTPLHLAEKPGARELAQVATPEHRAVVDAVLMDKTLRGQDRTGYAADEIARADEALARIAAVMLETDQLMDAHLALRLALPVDPVPLVLTRIARAIVRYELHKDRVTDPKTDPVARDYYDAMRLLEGIRDGKVSVGANDPVSAESPALDVRIESGRKAFGGRELSAFR